MARIFNPQNHLGQSLVTKQELTAEITKITDLTEKLSLKIEVIEGELPTTVDSTYTVERLQSTIFLKEENDPISDTDHYREYICANIKELTDNTTTTIKWEELGYIDNVTVPATTDNHGTVKIVNDVTAEPKDEATGPYVPTHKAVKTAIDDIQTTIGTLATKTELNGAKSELEGKIDNAKSELNNTITSTKSELEGKINSAKSELSGEIDEKIGTAKSDLEKQIEDAKSDLSDEIDEKIADVKSELEEITTTLGDISADDLKEVVQAIDSLDETIDGKVKDVLVTEKVTVTAAYSGQIGGSNPGYIQFDIVQGETFIAAYIDSGSGDELCLPDVKYITTSGSATQMKVTMLNTTDTGVPAMTLKVITSKPYVKSED